MIQIIFCIIRAPATDFKICFAEAVADMIDSW